jgi:hypothetical protein
MLIAEVRRLTAIAVTAEQLESGTLHRWIEEIVRASLVGR